MKITLTLFALMLLATCVASISVLQRMPNKVIQRQPIMFDIDSEFSIDVGSACQRNTTDRGQGTFPDTCQPGQERQGLLCYWPCKANFTGVGPVCWQDCPPGFDNAGAFCKPYSQWGDSKYCPLKDKCGLLYNSTKDCVICPEGMVADGCICHTPGHLFAKHSYHRDSYTLFCAEGLVEQAGLCYEPCPDNSTGVGQVCWKDCSGSTAYSCGGAICTSDKKECSRQLNELAKDLAKLQIQLAQCLLDTDRSEKCREKWIQKKEAVKKIISSAPEDEEEEKEEDQSVFSQLYKYFHDSFMSYHHGNNSNPHHHHHIFHHHHHHHNTTHCNATEIQQQIDHIQNKLDLPVCN